MGFITNRIERDQLKPGDHIYSYRTAYIYAHHGIYVGDGKVIHFTPGEGQVAVIGSANNRVFSSSPARSLCWKCGDQSRLRGVSSPCLDCFLSGGELYLFEYGVNPAIFLFKVRGATCTLASSDPVEDVLYRASYLLQNGFDVYDIFKNNCVDFAIYCKTGLIIISNKSKGQGSEVATLLAVTSTIISSPVAILMTTRSPVGFGLSCACRLVSDVGFRPDVRKIPVERLVASGLGTASS